MNQINREFTCKISNSEPINTAERIADIPMLGLGRTLLRDAIAKIENNSFSLICEDIFDKKETILEIEINQINSISKHIISTGSQISTAFKKSMKSGFGLGIGIMIIMFFRVGAETGINADQFVGIIFGGIFIGLLLGFLFSFLPNLFRTKGALIGLFFNLSGDRVFFIAIHSKQELEVLEAFTTAGLNLKHSSDESETTIFKKSISQEIPKPVDNTQGKLITESSKWSEPREKKFTPATFDSLGYEPLPQEMIILTVKACQIFWFNAHLDCSAIITNKRLIYWNRNKEKYSFQIGMNDLQTAKLYPKNHTDLIIEMNNGEKYEIGLKEGLWDKIVDTINKQRVT